MFDILIPVTNEEDLRLSEHYTRFAYLAEGKQLLLNKILKTEGNAHDIPFFLMDYAKKCEDEYYMIWDADTIPCRNIRMFDDGGIPYLDIRTELRDGRYEVMKHLIPGLGQMIEKSFCSQHMLIKTSYMLEMIDMIEANDETEGSSYQDKIKNAEKIESENGGVFDLYELYGSFIMQKHPESYRLREWHTFRQGGDLFDPTGISDSDFDWLGKDFDAITFLAGHTVREDNRGLFDNPEYQRKYTAGQMLQAAQGEFRDDYIKDWESGPIPLIASYAAKRKESEYLIYDRLGEERKDKNPRQAFLCWQHAEYLCPESSEKIRIRKRRDALGVVIPKTSIVIVSFNARSLMQECLTSIQRHSTPEERTVIVVDNASTDGVADELKKRDDIILKCNEENRGFPAACNQGIELAPAGEDILFLNNDTRLTHNALFWLRMGLYASDDIGASGSVSNYAGVGQMRGLLLAQAENYTAYGRRINIPMNEPFHDAKILCGFSMLVRRSIIDQYGGMDEIFTPGYFEDTDLSLRIRKYGYRLSICDNSFIYHAGGTNFKKRPDANAIEERNFINLVKRWGADFMERDTV